MVSGLLRHIFMSNNSQATVRAFTNIVREMDLIALIVRNATSKSSDGKITRTDFLAEATSLTSFVNYSPMEADILFHFAGLVSDLTTQLILPNFHRTQIHHVSIYQPLKEFLTQAGNTQKPNCKQAAVQVQ